MRTLGSWFLFSSVLCCTACGGGTSSSNPPAPPSVVVTISPTSANLQTAGVQQFEVKLTNASNTAVEWRVNGIAGGNDTVGTISTSGLYTAPPCVVPDPPVVNVSAISQADSSEMATAAVSLASTVSNLAPEFLYMLAADRAQIIALKIDPASGCINQSVQTQTFQLDDDYRTSEFSAVPSVDGKFLFVLFNGFGDGNGHVSVPGLLKVFTIDKASGLPQEVAGSASTLPGVGINLRANPIANFLYVKSQFPDAMVVLQYDPDVGALTLKSVDSRTDSSAITDFAISPKGNDLSAIERMQTSVGGSALSLRHFALNAGTGILTPAAVSQGIPFDPIFPASGFVILTSTFNLFSLGAEGSADTFSTFLFVYRADSATSMFGSPSSTPLGSYNSDAEEGTIVNGLVVSADGQNVFYPYTNKSINFVPATGLVFTNSCSLGRLSIGLGTNMPSSQSPADFGVDCVINSSLLTQEGNYFYAKTETKIVGASIAADGTLRVIGSTVQPLLEFPQDPGGEFIASVTPK